MSAWREERYGKDIIGAKSSEWANLEEGGSDFTEKVTQKSFLKDEWGFSKLS